MKTIVKEHLVDGVYYEGFDADEHAAVARWSAADNAFLVNDYHWLGKFVTAMTYETEVNEYFTSFSPLLEVKPKEHELVDADDFDIELPEITEEKGQVG